MEKKIKHYSSDYRLKEIIKAIEKDDKEKAIQEATALYQGCKIMHDGLVDQFSLALNYIAENEGEEGIGRVWRYISDNNYVPRTIAGLKSGKLSYETYRDYVRLGEISHFSDFTEEEDDEKTVFSMNKCGVCSRMVCEKKLDRQEGGALNLGTIKEAHEWTCGQTGMPYYCVHAPHYFNIDPKANDVDMLEWIWGRMTDDDGNIINEPCKEIIYKKPRNK